MPLRLPGLSFSSVWGSRSPDELFEYLRREMPPGQGGALSDAVYRSLVAFILQSNDPTADVTVRPSLTEAAAEPRGRTTRFGGREAAEVTPVTDALLRQPPAASRRLPDLEAHARQPWLQPPR